MMFKKIARFGLDDIEEFEELLKNTQNQKVLQILNRDLNIVRSKLATKVINGSSKDRMEDEPPSKPKKKALDENKYFLSNIRGYKRKIRAIKECHTGLSTSKIIDALIRFKGKEDDTTVGLFGEGKLPPRPVVPHSAYEEHEEKYKKELEDYEKRLKIYEEKKKRTVIEDLPPNPSQEDILRRTEFVKKEIKSVEELCQMYGHMKVVAPRVKKNKKRSNISFEEENIIQDREKLFLPGEKEAIERDEPRLFTFLPERTFSNEVNHVHFRVAESQFFRMSNAQSMRVKEVKYIVSPHLIRKFEICKRSFRSTKQYLFFSPHIQTEKELEWIRHNNYRPTTFKRGRLFSCRKDFCTRFINDSGFMRVLVCLVVSGREKVQAVSTPSGKKGCNIMNKPPGYDSVIDSKRDNLIIFNQDQVLPYYIIEYEKQIAQGYNVNHNAASGQKKTKHLAEEWEDMRAEANADLQQDQIKRSYLEELRRKEKEKKFGKIDPTKENLWFDSYYKKQSAKEKGIMGKGDEETPTLGDGDEELEIVFETPTPGTPGDGLSDGMFDSSTPIETPLDTPLDDDMSPAFEEEEEEGEIVFMVDEED